MTLAAKLEDFEVTLEHLLMDVFVSKGFPLFCMTDLPLHSQSLHDSVPIPDEDSIPQWSSAHTVA